MITRHPRRDSQGVRRVLDAPSEPTELAAWVDSSRVATVVPDGQMPVCINGLAVVSWREAPRVDAGWHALVDGCDFAEPEFRPRADMRSASGAVVVEPDRRVWVVSPSNRFQGYVNTFPKGTLADCDRQSMRANALQEVFEESGLKVALVGFLVDSIRSASVTRYYLARRLSGNPADMGWGSQAVHLVPPAALKKFLNREFDHRIVERLQQLSLVESFGAGFFVD